MSTLPIYHFSVRLSADTVRSIYEGRSRFVLVHAEEGLKLQLPATNFRPFVTADGIQGRFRVRLDAQNKIQSFQRL